MKKEIKIMLSLALLIIGLLGFILHIFVFVAPDGHLGFLLCLLNTTLIFGNIGILYKKSTKFRQYLWDILDLLFLLP